MRGRVGMHNGIRPDRRGRRGQPYSIHIPGMMIRGEAYRGVIVAELPAHADRTFRFGAGSGDVMLPDYVTIPAGSNHALFDIIPVDSTMLSGRITTGLTVIQPDGAMLDIPVETHPGTGTVLRLWMVGPGADGVACDAPPDAPADAAARAAEGVFDTPSPDKEIRTRLSHTTVHVFLADRYCTPVTAPPGGVSFTVSSDTPALAFGNGRTHITGVIPRGYNSAVLDVTVNGAGIIYATGSGVSSNSIRRGRAGRRGDAPGHRPVAGHGVLVRDV